jgi:TolA-binding protein
MRTSTLFLSLLLSGCVWDRTGQSATEAWRREMVVQSTRTQTLHAAVEDTLIRVEQLEEVTRARGQDEILRMETMDQLRNEVSRLRGDLEVLQHEAGITTESEGKFREDAEFRLAWLEARAQALEESLGLEPVEPPAVADAADTGLEEGGPAAVDGDEPSDGEGDEGGEQPGDESSEGPRTVEERIALAEEHMKEGRYVAARAIYQRLVQADGVEEQLPELRYQLAETSFHEGRYQEAILAYQDVVDHHGDSDRAPWAMLRQGECFEAMGERENALLFFDDVMRLFPKSKAAKEAKAHKSR